MEQTEIAWTDHTFNPWICCTRVSEGCTTATRNARHSLRLDAVGPWRDAQANLGRELAETPPQPGSGTASSCSLAESSTTKRRPGHVDLWDRSGSHRG